jgi:hypothetical protein
MDTLLLLLLLWALVLPAGIGVALWLHLSPSPLAARVAARLRGLADDVRARRRQGARGDADPLAGR